MCTRTVDYQQFINKVFMQTTQIKFLKNLTKYALHYESLSFFISKPHTIFTILVFVTYNIKRVIRNFFRMTP